MNLHNLSDQEFDQALRNHLEDPGIPYDPVSWNKMNRKLDTVFPPDDGSRGFLPWLVLTGLLSTVFFWSLFTFSQSGDEMGNAGSLPVNSGLKVEQGGIPSVNNEIESPIIQKNKAELVKEQLPVVQIADDKSVNSVLLKQSEKESTILAAKHDNQFTVPSGAGEESVIASVHNYQENVVGSSNQHLSRVQGNQAVTDPDISITLRDSIEAVEISEIEDFPVIERPTRSPWFIGFGYAPDISLVGSGDATSPGTNLNLTVEYMLGNRWSIQSGIIYSMKRYKAAGEDYNPPPGFWYYGNAPDNADGECDVIDIPLNIRYYIKPNSKHRFFASTGLSSYLMLTEDYYYQYDGYPNPNQVDSWSVRNENQHYFGVYNLSAGYQRSLGARWFLEIEPFIKLPLSGVGFGRVDLWSTGSTFSLKYNFR